MDRRDFLKFIGVASSATALSSCGAEKATEKIVSKLVVDEDIIPGEAYYKTSTCTECPAGCGVSVKTVDYNAIKLEGLPGHPLNDGALCLRGQASLTRLYHPNRVKAPMAPKKAGLNLDRMSGDFFENVSWEEAYKMIRDAMQKSSSGGRSNVYLSGRTTGSLSELIDEFCAQTSTERLPEYEPYSNANLRAAYKALFGQNTLPACSVQDADYLVTIGADVLETFMNPVAFGSQLAKARENSAFEWLHFEPHVSLSGFKANERKQLPPGSEAYLLIFLVRYLNAAELENRKLPASILNALPTVSDAQVTSKTGLSIASLNQIGQKLASEKALLISGGVSTQQQNGYEVAILTALVQWLSGMTGKTVDFASGSDYSKVGSLLDLQNFANRLKNKNIGVAFVTRTNLAFATAPASLGIAENIKNADFKVAFTDVLDAETAKAAAEVYDLILPLSHGFESWGDASPQNGLLNIQQPTLNETIYDTRTEGDILLGLAGMSGSYEDYVKNKWAASGDVEAAIEKGYISTPAAAANLSLAASAAAFNGFKLDAPASGSTLYIVPSIRKYDGRSGDLQLTSEVPDPLSTVSYGSWLSVSKETAESLNFERAGADSLIKKYRDEVKISSGETSLELPSWVQPGLHKDVAVIQREQIDVSALTFDARTGEELARLDNVGIERTGNMVQLAAMAGGIEQGDRPIIPHGDHAHHGHVEVKGDETLYPDPYDRYTEYRWMMAVDMESCTGCGACVSACFVENNIPCVGEEESLKGREMSWLRIQPYYDDHGGMDSLVMLCQQCDFAPCENVCPVYATYHNEEGLNVMVYNRCVGTRYCHNNCPYKVRRFNWFDWADEGYWDGPMARMQNPDIWVRPKGVMEKCTFCVQRIRVAKDQAKDREDENDRMVKDGEVVPACAQTCPTDAISFGNILDKNSEVAKKIAASEDKFRVLEMLGTGPAVYYLRKEEKA